MDTEDKDTKLEVVTLEEFLKIDFTTRPYKTIETDTDDLQELASMALQRIQGA